MSAAVKAAVPAASVASTPRKAPRAKHGHTAEELAIIIQGFRMDVESKLQGMRRHMDTSIAAYESRALSVIASIPKQLHNMTLREFEDRFGGDIARAVRGEALEQVREREGQGKEEEWEAARKRKRAGTPAASVAGTEDDAPQTSNKAAKSARKNPPSSSTAPASAPRRTTRVSSSARATRASSRRASTAPSPGPRPPSTSSFNPLLPNTPLFPSARRPKRGESILSINGSPLVNPLAEIDEGEDLPDPDAVQAEVLAGLHTNGGGKGSKRQSVKLLPAGAVKPVFGLTIPLPSGGSIVLDPLTAGPDALDNLDGVPEDDRAAVKEEFEKRLHDLQVMMSRWGGVRE